jgi:dolichyl-phosphate beta-glucosyltransferase
MLHSRGELLLMLDADGATKVTDLEKLEAQVCHKLNQNMFYKVLLCIL